MKILITNQQRRIRLDRRELIRLTKFFMAKAAAMNPAVNWVECSVVLVGHREMIALNERALKHEGTTDVITFQYPTAPGEQPAGRRGEIVINVEEADEVAARRGAPAMQEVALYLAHGCQHLGGADDATPRERAAMSRRQNRWLKAAHLAKSS
jgi:probable rRNA maturation factor